MQHLLTGGWALSHLPGGTLPPPGEKGTYWGGGGGSKVKEVLLQRDLFEVGKPRKLQVYLVEG